MSRHPQIYSWSKEIASHLPGLNPALATALAMWSVGMILANRCGLDSVAGWVSSLLNQPFETSRQRLREFYQEGRAKRGRNRKDFDVHSCFAPLLTWVLSFWSDNRLALAMDVTNLGDRFHVLCISVLYGGIGIPVAWKIILGNTREAWHPHWCQLLKFLKPAIPENWQVIVLSDRGLESGRLFSLILELEWHPLMRVKGGGKFRPQGWRNWYYMKDLVPRPKARFAMKGVAYKNERMSCTLLACWEPEYSEAWLLLTDLEPAAANPCWYGWRAWIEQGFKVAKSGCLNWQNTRMTIPERAERHFLAIAVTTLWAVAIGAEVERQELIETIRPMPMRGKKPKRKKAKARRRRLFVIGKNTVVSAMINKTELPKPMLYQKNWPTSIPLPPLKEADFRLLHVDLQL